MKSVNIAELKAHLSHYLRLVRKGDPILVLDRNRVVARIAPAEETVAIREDDERWLGELEKTGVLSRASVRLPRKRLDELVAKLPRCEGDIVAAILSEREEGA